MNRHEPVEQHLGSGPRRGFSLHIPAHPTLIAPTRSAIRRTVRFHSDELGRQFMTALTEVLTHAIEDQRRGSGGVDVVVTSDEPASVSVMPAPPEYAPSSRDPRSTDEADDGVLIAVTLVPTLTVRLGRGAPSCVVLPLDGFGTPP